MTEITRLPSIESVPDTLPELWDEGQFARQRGLRLGSLSVQKDKIEIDNGTQVTMRLSADGLFAYGTTTGVLRFRSTEADTVSYGLVGFSTTSDAFYIASGNDKHFYILTSSDATNMVVGADKTLLLNANTDGNNAGDFALRNDGSNVYKFYDPGVPGYRTLTMSADKTAIMPTSKGYRALYCTESPDVWFMDFCNAKKKRKWPKFWEFHWDVKVDSLFEEVTTQPYIVMPTVHKNIVQVWAKRRGQEGKRFEKKTKKEFEANDAFWSQAKKVKE